MSQKRNGSYITSNAYTEINTLNGFPLPPGLIRRPGIWKLEEVLNFQNANSWPTFPTSANGQVNFTTPGTFTFVASTTMASIVCVGGGGGSGFSQSGAGGGGLGYKNNYPLVVGELYTVVVGAGGFGNPGVGGDSYFISPSIVKGGGGTFGGGNFVGDGGGNGGPGGPNGSSGGAAGYSGNGGPANGNAPPGGGGGGGPIWRGNNQWGGGGGGVGLNGEGNPGTVGAPGPSTSPGWTGFQGNGGSGGGGGELTSFGALHGGGGAGTNRSFGVDTWTRGGNGAVRIIFSPSVPRSYPSTNTGNI